MHRSFRRGGALAALASLLIVGAAGSRLNTSAASATPTAHTTVASRNTDWSSFGGGDTAVRFSPLTQITPSNVRTLGVAWTAQQGKNLIGWETVPVVVNGVMYYTTQTDQVRAVNAATGKLLWQYTPKVDFYRSIAGGGGGVAQNRGVTVVNGTVYLVTFDARLIALQASTGEKLWTSNVADPNAGYAESSPATYWNGLLFIGSEEGDAGQRGFEAAFDAKTGKQVWKFYTVPKPGDGWMPKAGHHGGGDVWMPSTVDPTTGLIYFGTGNPSPDFNNLQRPGCNPWVNAIVALHAKTGKLAWAYTEFCNDVWDYDSMPQPFLMNLKIHSKMTRVVGHGNKAGKFFFFEAKTGKLLATTPWIANYSIPHLKPTAKGVRVCPGAVGGIEYGPPSYNPQMTSMFEGYLNSCEIYKTLSLGDINSHQPGQVDAGGSAALDGPVTGGLVAIDPRSGKILWRHPFAKPIGGGTLATASGLVFSGVDDGKFYAFDGKTGKILWSGNTGIGFGAAPIAYSVNGTEYIAIAAGGGASSGVSNAPEAGTLYVLKLGGSPVKKAPVNSSASGVPVNLPALRGYTKIGKWMYTSPQTHHVIIQAIAATTGANAGFNFDGYYKGQATFTVPTGWSVDLEYANLAALPHSVGITSNTTGQPKLEYFGFAPVLSRNAFAGNVGKDTQLLGFRADHSGTFYMVCLVPGHLQSGMWDKFVVSPTAKAPSLATAGM